VDTHDGVLAYAVVGPKGPIAGARVLLVPQDAAHQAQPPDCICQPDPPPAQPGVVEDPPDPVGALSPECTLCPGGPEELMALAERAIGSLPDQEQRSSDEGVVRFAGLSTTKSFAVRVEAAGMAPSTLQSETPWGAANPEDPHPIKVSPPATLAVQVQDMQGHPLADAQVAGFIEIPFQATKLQRDGVRFTTTSLGQKEDSVMVLAMAPGYLPTMRWVTVSDEAEVIQLQLPSHFRGHALHQGKPVADAAVQAKDNDTGHLFKATTNKRGEFLIDGLPMGDFELTATQGKLKGTTTLSVSVEDPAPDDTVINLLEQGTVKGVVRDAATQKPVPSASVVFESEDGMLSQSADCDEQGEFTLKEVVPAPYKVTATETDHLPGHATLTVAEGQDAHVEVLMTAGLVLKGLIVDGHNKPIADARIQDTTILARPGDADSDSERNFYGHSDDDGHFEIHGLPPGHHQLEVTHDEHPTLSQGLELPCQDVTLHMKDGAVIEGVVRGPAGLVEGAQVQVAEAGGAGNEHSAETDDKGHFRLGGLAPGQLHVAATFAGLRPSAVRTLDLSDGQTIEVELVLTEGLSLAGKVVDDKEQPLTEVTLEIFPMASPKEDLPLQGLSQRVSPATSDEHGHFEVKGLAPGSYRLMAYHEGLYQDATPTAEAGTHDLVIRLIHSGSVKGRVVNRSGAPVKRFTVDGTSFASDEGTFELPDVNSANRMLLFEGDFQTRTVKVDATPGQVTDMGDVVVDLGEDLKGRVLLPDGRAAAGVTVQATPVVPTTASVQINGEAVADELGGEGSASTDAHGDFAVQHLKAGQYTLQVTGPNGSVQTALGSPGTPVEIQLQPGAELDGHVDFQGGTEACQGAVLVMAPAGTSVLSGRILAGAFHVSGIPAGAQDVQVVCREGLLQGESRQTVTFSSGQTQTVSFTVQAVPKSPVARHHIIDFNEPALNEP
jgi:hypothetical protein